MTAERRPTFAHGDEMAMTDLKQGYRGAEKGALRQAAAYWSGARDRWPETWNLRSAARNLVALPAAVAPSPCLISSRGHEALLSCYRLGLISARVQAASILLSLVTAAWIPIDVVLFHGDWGVVMRLAIGRLITAALFWMIGSMELRSDNTQHGVGTIGLMVGVGVGFVLFAHAATIGAHEIYAKSLGHEQYVLMPIALAAGISIFPLTIIEAVLLVAPSLLGLTLEALHRNGALVWPHAEVALFLMGPIMAIAVTCSVGQLNLLINLFEQSAEDPLTKVLSRRAGAELLGILFAQSERSNAPLSLVFFDLDRFKLVNDNYGHRAGDVVLQTLIQRLKGRMRGQDAIIRWGGEEFVIVFPSTDAAEAAAVMTQLCLPGLGTRPDGTQQTVSVGLAERVTDAARNWQTLVDIADKRMYEAKKLGRKRLVGPKSEVRLVASTLLAA
jgi:diguanylate cyclase (GGDEF)-like protein